MMNVVRHVSCLAPLLLAGCILPTPLRIEHVGTLSPARYAEFDEQAAAHPGVKAFNAPGTYPEPKWIFSLGAPLDLHAAPLRVGAFDGTGRLAAKVAKALPEAAPGAARRLAPVRRGDPAGRSACPRAVRHGDAGGRRGRVGSLELDAGTQVEATISQDGRSLGAIQVNSLQVQYSPMSPLPSLIFSAVQGSRTAFLGERFADVFAAIAKGARRGLSVGGVSKRYLHTLPAGAGPPQLPPGREVQPVGFGPPSGAVRPDGDPDGQPRTP